MLVLVSLLICANIDVSSLKIMEVGGRRLEKMREMLREYGVAPQALHTMATLQIRREP